MCCIRGLLVVVVLIAEILVVMDMPTAQHGIAMIRNAIGGEKESYAMAEILTRKDVERICNEARSKGSQPNLHGANLHGADLYGANLYGADLCGADLRWADLHGADLCGANLHGANLYGADLYGANLCGANLYGANLRWADLCGADLCGADLHGANLQGADLHGANLRDARLPHYQIPEGTLIAWGKKAGKLVKYEIPAEAKRTASLMSRKCRVEYALVLEIEDATEVTVKRAPFPPLTYRVGEIAYPDSYDPDPAVDCSHGIHVFMTREEAEEWIL